jgi:hypothetical protein
MALLLAFSLPQEGWAIELWRADFDFTASSKARGWEEIEGFWDVVDNSYRGNDRGVAWSLQGEADWEHLVFEGRFLSAADDPADVALLFRVRDVSQGKGRGHYYMVENSVRQGGIRLWLVEDDRILLEEADCDFEPGTWYTFAIEARGLYVRVSIDRSRVLSYDRADEIQRGRIGLGVFGGTAFFDDLIVFSAEPPDEDDERKVIERLRPIPRTKPRKR